MSRLEPYPQQGIEAHPIMPSAIPTKHELVEIRLQIPLTKAVINAQPKPLKVREDSMNPRHEDVSSHLTNDAGIVRAIRHVGVGRVAVRPDGAALGRGAGHERMERLAVATSDGHQADSSGRLAVLEFDRTSNGNLADGAAALSAADGFVLRAEGNSGFVDLDNAFKRVAVRVNHCLAESVKQEPRALVRANAELRLELEGGNAVRMCRDEMGSKEPSAERQVRGVHYSPGSDRNLLMALSALPMMPFRFHPPTLLTLAMRTAKAVWPTLLGEVFSAGRVVRKHRHELLERWRLVLGPTGGLFEGLAHVLTMAGLPTPNH